MVNARSNWIRSTGVAAWACLVPAAPVACGGDDDDSGGGGRAGSTLAAGAAGVGGGSAGRAGSGGSGAGAEDGGGASGDAAAGAGGQGAMPPMHLDLEVPSGRLSTVCRTFANVTDAALHVRGLRSDGPPDRTGQRLLRTDVFVEPGATDGAETPCSPPLSRLPDFVAIGPSGALNYPDGVRLIVPADAGFLVVAQYLNQGDAPVQIRVTVTADTEPAVADVEPAGMVVFSNVQLQLMGPTPTSRGTCQLPQAITAVAAASWTHGSGTAMRFGAPTAVPLYDAQGATGERPMAAFEPPVALPAEAFELACDYDLLGSPGKDFGEDWFQDEQCSLYVAAYPRLVGGGLVPCQ